MCYQTFTLHLLFPRYLLLHHAPRAVLAKAGTPNLYQPAAATTSEIATSAVGRVTDPARSVPGQMSQGVTPPIHWRVGLPSTVSSGCVEQAWSGAKGGWRKRAAEHLHGCGNIGCCGGSGSGGQGEISRTGKWAGRAGNGG